MGACLEQLILKGKDPKVDRAKCMNPKKTDEEKADELWSSGKMSLCEKERATHGTSWG